VRMNGMIDNDVSRNDGGSLLLVFHLYSSIDTEVSSFDSIGSCSTRIY
jgi:hypothetical protein